MHTMSQDLSHLRYLSPGMQVSACKVHTPPKVYFVFKRMPSTGIIMYLLGDRALEPRTEPTFIQYRTRSFDLEIGSTYNKFMHRIRS